MHIAVKEWRDEIVFLRKLVAGGTSRSYGIQVGRLAGLPQPVVVRAREILKNLEAGELDQECQPRLSRSRGGRARGRNDSRQLNLFAAAAGDARPAKPSAVEERLAAVTPDALTPIEALQLVYELHRKLKRES
jgi:DNA mismatch repair protein MutS